MENHFPGIPMITCKSVQKSIYCLPGDILIDDTVKYRDKWERAGGLFVPFVNYGDSRSQLQQLGVVW